MATATGLTIDDFERLPQDLAHNRELVDGELIDVSGNTAEHNDARDFLGRRLRDFVEQHHLGMVLAEQEFDFDGNVHGPDLSFFREAKRPLVEWKRRVQRFGPDLAIEIVSTNDTFQSLIRKAQRYRGCGTREVWIFDLENRQAYVYSESRRAILDEHDEFRPEPIPGFAMRIGDMLSRY